MTDTLTTGPVLGRSLAEPIRTGLSWTEAWQGPDRGLICCWERGREMRTTGEVYPKDGSQPPQPLWKRAAGGELLRLPWKNGIELQNGPGLFAPLQYLAMWQGLRGEDLHIELEGGQVCVCTVSGRRVTFIPWATARMQEDGDPGVASSPARAPSLLS